MKLKEEILTKLDEISQKELSHNNPIEQQKNLITLFLAHFMEEENYDQSGTNPSTPRK